MLFLVVFVFFFFLSSPLSVGERETVGASERQSVGAGERGRASALCNPGLCENVITRVSKPALVYVSEMAPVKSESGLPADAQLQMSRSQGVRQGGGRVRGLERRGLGTARVSHETTMCSNADKKKQTTKTPAPPITRRNRFRQRGRKKKAASRKLTGTADGGGARANMTPVGEEIKGKGSAVSSPSDEQ